MPRMIKCKTCPAEIYYGSQSGQCRTCATKAKIAAKPETQLATDRERERLLADRDLTNRKYKQALKDIKQLESELRVVNQLKEIGITPVRIEPKEPTGTAEGTVVLVASDWHVEERVKPASVSGLNRYDLDVAKARAEKFFRASLRLIRLLQQDIKVHTAILALLGDFITNDIHEEMPENNQLEPMHALVFAQNLIAGGIRFLLDHSKLNLVIPCHSGNHARTTRTTRFSSENGHSLEYLMYLHLATEFKDEPRVEFRIADGYHSYVDVYGKTLRFHHGHAINYQGGIGGIFIPAFKAISQWDKARQADLDIFGHFHQMKDGGKFVSNGSLIGFNSYALSIKADFEHPRQTLLLLDKDRGRTCTWPILFTR